MARDGLFALVCAGVVSVAGPHSVVQADPGEANAPSIATTLAVQTALQQGREHLLRGNAEAAVYALEGQLARINGNREYLMVLRDAYRAHIKEARRAKKHDLAQQYVQRLLILDPGASLYGSVTRAANSPVPPAAPAKAPAPEPARQPPAAREKPDDPFHENNSKENHARKLVEQARQEFGRERYDTAGRLFEEAAQADPSCTQDCREPWGYCRLRRVGEMLNDPATKVANYAELEREVGAAVSLA